MTLDELLGEAAEAARDGALFELPGKEAQELVEDLVEYSIQHERLGALLGFLPGSAPSIGEIVTLIEREFAAAATLSAEVRSIPKGADSTQLLQRLWNLKDLANKGQKL